MTDIVERLRTMGNAPFLSEAAEHIEALRVEVAYWRDLYADTLSEDDATIHNLLDENKMLRERLEVAHVYDVNGNKVKVEVGLPAHLDAVACRDETIKALENQTERLRAQASGIIEHAYDLTRQIKAMRAEIARLRVEAGYD